MIPNILLLVKTIAFLYLRVLAYSPFYTFCDHSKKNLNDPVVTFTVLCVNGCRHRNTCNE